MGCERSERHEVAGCNIPEKEVTVEQLFYDKF
jgi:hypothetical protein